MKTKQLSKANVYNILCNRMGWEPEDVKGFFEACKALDLLEGQPYRIIPRLECFNGAWRPCLFLPDDKNGALIGHYCEREGHSSASLDYYRKTKPANQEARDLAAAYAHDIPGAVIRQRIQN